ncbi:uncharacterized protein LOC132264916 [Phlebotomus argentipes]|uniref:uncharacterized protein LOC132264916 n=1 Tax=Phlebotomus argentipes TaxID=94469 RepID=UPI0028932A81|nr:uncharacterized protein LOC132264916 [Phlebotomus argentipes]
MERMGRLTSRGDPRSTNHPRKQGFWVFALSVISDPFTEERSPLVQILWKYAIMKLFMHSTVYVTMILICCVIWVACSFPVAMSCDSCGRECANACGTRHFRTCCFNYLKRKRSSLPPLKIPEDSLSDIRYLLWPRMDDGAHDDLGDTFVSDLPPGFVGRLRDGPAIFRRRDGHNEDNLPMHKSKILEDTDSGQQARLYEA